MCMCAHFCSNMVHCGIWDWCTVGFMKQVITISALPQELPWDQLYCLISTYLDNSTIENGIKLQPFYESKYQFRTINNSIGLQLFWNARNAKKSRLHIWNMEVEIAWSQKCYRGAKLNGKTLVLTYEILLLNFTVISDVYITFIRNKTALDEYCLTKWIPKLTESFENKWVRQYLVNFTGLAGIVNARHRSRAWRIFLTSNTEIY